VALIDDEQLANAKQLDDGDKLRVIWKSGELPPTPVIAFGKVTTAPDRKKVADALAKLCGDAQGKPICDDMSIDKFAPVDKAAFAEAIRKYDAPAAK
jgi:ABC-type phosphate/phosphonate transport system substrate-binding protein